MRLWFKFLREERAVVAATTAVLMPALILFLALAVEVGEWYTMDRQLQSVADAAAVAAALELAAGGPLASATTKAGYSATADGFSVPPNPLPVVCLTTVGVPPNPDVTGPCGPQISNTPGYVKAIVSRTQPTVFANLYESSVTVGASAVASWTEPYQSCGLAIGAGPAGVPVTAITTTGTPTVTLGTGCVLASQSTAADSLDLSGANAVTAQTLISAGGINGTCTTCATTPVVDGPVVPDPLSCSLLANAGFCTAVSTIPSPCGSMFATAPISPLGPGCYNGMAFGASFLASINGTTMIVSSVASGALQAGMAIAGTGITPGTYIQPFGTGGTTGTGAKGTYAVSAPQTVSSEPMGTQLQLQPGTYYAEGNFDVQGGTVTGSGVTIVVTNAGGCEGNISFEGNTTTATLTAPNTGTFSGMLFIQLASVQVPPFGGCSSIDSIGVGPTTPIVTLAGAIYSPDATWTFYASPTPTCLSGVSPCSGANECLTVTANILVFGGTMDLEDGGGTGCTAPTGTDIFNVATISLVK